MVSKEREIRSFFFSFISSYPSYEFSLRFVPSRVPIRSMHQALDNLLVDTVLPSFYTTTDPMPFDISQCLQELDCTELNSAQKAAVKSMLDPACRMVSKTDWYFSSSFFSAGAISCAGFIWEWEDSHTV